MKKGLTTKARRHKGEKATRQVGKSLTWLFLLLWLCGFVVAFLVLGVLVIEFFLLIRGAR